MFRIGRPAPAEIQQRLAQAAAAPFTYAEVGATRAALPTALRRRYDVDQGQLVIGAGRGLFARARRALLEWRGFEIHWLELCGAQRPVEVGQVVATLVRAAGLFVLSPCRVVYVVDEPECAGFAYGTLPGHAEIGEERFLVAHEPETGAVRCEVLAFSRPGHPLARLGYPYARRLQRRFRRDALAALALASGR